MNQKYLAACVGMEPYCIKADAENIAAFIVKCSKGDCSRGHGIYDLHILKPMHEWRPEETGYTVISADDLKQMDRFDGEDMENER